MSEGPMTDLNRLGFVLPTIKALDNMPELQCPQSVVVGGPVGQTGGFHQSSPAVDIHYIYIHTTPQSSFTMTFSLNN